MVAMVEDGKRKPIDLLSYCPQRLEECVLLDGAPIPSRVFDEGEVAKWETMVTPAYVVVSNLIHKDFPIGYCQVQMSPGSDGNTNVMFLHAGDREDHISEGLVEKIFMGEMLPQILSELNKNKHSRNN